MLKSTNAIPSSLKRYAARLSESTNKATKSNLKIKARSTDRAPQHRALRIESLHSNAKQNIDEHFVTLYIFM